MASKKPARGYTYDQKVANTLIGNAVLYFGNTDKPFSCPACGRTFVKGITYEKDSKSACSRACLAELI
jgi:hypothetical protein